MSIYHIVKQSSALVSWVTNECVAGNGDDVLALSDIFFSIDINLHLAEVIYAHAKLLGNKYDGNRKT